MDGNRFDDIARRLASDTSRRSFLKRSAAAAAAIAGLGGASATDAARRSTPTPKPIPCPPPKVASGNQCVCPGGTTPCGPDCCPAGATCCDNACCYGQCYAEEQCCPSGQLVCDGVCLAPGQCCTDSDCASGLTCIANVCTCVATTSCQSAALSCGTFTDDCGAINDCGTCESPATCGGGGTEGVCGCLSQPDCTGKCGSYVDACGVSVDCPATCGDCQSCVEDSCVAVADGTTCTSLSCTQGATCVAGACQGGIPLVCQDDPGDPCNTVECDSELGCVKVPANEGGDCTTDPCVPSSCQSGTCIGLDMECPPCHSCSAGQCVQSDDGAVCSDGLHCYAGECCNMPTIGGVVPDSAQLLMECAATDQICCDASEGPCCPGTNQCCDMCVTIEGDGGRPTYNMCCPASQQCNGGCCWSTDMCVDGACVNRRQVCAGNVVCDDKCCGGDGEGTGTCCGDDAYCVNGACVAEQPVTCSDHETCVAIYGSSAVCAYMGIDFSNGQVIPGTCCPGGYSTIISSGSNAGQYRCCDPETRPTQFGCCGYPEYDCLDCTCSSTRVRRWGS